MDCVDVQVRKKTVYSTAFYSLPPAPISVSSLAVFALSTCAVILVVRALCILQIEHARGLQSMTYRDTERRGCLPCRRRFCWGVRQDAKAWSGQRKNKRDLLRLHRWRRGARRGRQALRRPGPASDVCPFKADGRGDALAGSTHPVEWDAQSKVGHSLTAMRADRTVVARSASSAEGLIVLGSF
ncbi:hypothetical protein B0H15DRAFT_487514 [Mycena belliarum]|uniref:Uncharacterized protein n=1 Tax=Mycena belliarum TaxID=1033014 RepID=A0AAD6XQ77_9AGAR|nr:hypothetical protein B0H15DRAFT_487514 [Mycena belliae]